jgi:hypothetical protein
MKNNIVTLSKNELVKACEIANLRMNGVKLMNLRDKHGAEEQKNFKYHILGARGEMAFKKFIGDQEELTFNTFKSKPDVGDFEVRTRSKDHYDLILRKDDPDDKTYVLVVGESCRYRIVGWIKGSEKYLYDKKTYNDRPSAWFIPQSALHSMEEI